MKTLFTNKPFKNINKSSKNENNSQIDIDDIPSVKETSTSLDSKNLIKNILKKIEIEEDYLNDIRQYLNIPIHQKEFKDKGIFLKKLIPIYKKIHKNRI